MIWDLVIAYFGVTFAIAGWNIGWVNSWPAPFAMLAATLVTQYFYVDAAVWLVQEMELPGSTAVFLAYCALWLAFEFVAEMALLLIVPLYKKYGLKRWERAAGAGIGFAKALTLMLFATLASICATDMPAPPHYPMISLWFFHSSHESSLLRGCRALALNMPETLAQTVVSPFTASFAPNFEKRPIVQTDPEQTRRFRLVFEALKQFEREADQY